MRLVLPDVLARFRGPGICGYCGRSVRMRHAHHIFSKGAGRVDIPGNIIGLCCAFSGGDNCHGRFHDGHILRDDLLAVAAAREGCLQRDIEEDVYLIRRLPKETTKEQLYAMRELRSVARTKRKSGVPKRVRG